MNKPRLFVIFIGLVFYTCEDPTLSKIDQAGMMQTSGIDLIMEDMGGENPSGTEAYDQDLTFDQAPNDSFLNDSGISDSSLSVDMEQSLEDMDQSLEDMDLSCGDQSSCPEPLSCVSTENEEWCACSIGYTIDEAGETCIEVPCPTNHGQTMGTCSEGGTCSATCNNGTWQANHYGCFANSTYTWSEIQAFNYGLLDDPFSCVEPLPRTPMCTSGAGSACSSSGAKCKEWLECSDGAYYVMGRICQ